MISFAGLYTYRKDFPGESCTMMTTAAEGCALDYHHRIPVILRGEEEIGKWLDPSTDFSELVPLFKCIPDELFEARVHL